MRQLLFIAAGLAALAPLASASSPPLLPSSQVAAIGNELSGEAAKRTLEGLARFHRQRGSEGFHAAAEWLHEALNFADGRHSVQQVAEELSAEYGPVAVDLVLEYLEALKRIGVVE